MAYVGLGSRFVAFIIDALLAFVVIGPLALFGLRGFLFEALLPALAVLAFWRRYGATPGKMAVGARIVDAKTGGAPSTGRLIARYAAYLVSMLPLFLGFAWIAIDRRKQGWHDKIAGTVVIDDDD
ncbi:MAG TPA: RDD family protein [Burkholderiales bacterium]|nr:RDD family protein [Burkholderiales bacterium]